MARVIPFRGILYNPDKVKGDEVFAPPYDIISPELKEILYQKSPCNIVRIDFGKELPGDTGDYNRYTRAREYFEKWMSEDVLVRDDRPSFYAYEIDYHLSGQEQTLRGLLAVVRIEELGNGIYPHEATYSKPKADRLNLMRACLANVSPIYSLYHSTERVTSQILHGVSGEPHISGKDADGAVHRVFRISEPSSIESIMRELSDKPIFIADGHHRYEVALEFKREMESQQRGRQPRVGSQNSGRERGSSDDQPWNYILMFLANMADEGITILPTHRLVTGLPPKDELFKRLGTHFTVHQLPLNADIMKALAEKGKNSIGFYLGREKQAFLLDYKGIGLEDVHPALKDLDVILLHELILKRDLGITDFAYEMSVQEAINSVHLGDFDGVFFLNSTTVGDVGKVALSHLRMPPKSTYFYPKLLTGVAINSFKNH